MDQFWKKAHTEMGPSTFTLVAFLSSIGPYESLAPQQAKATMSSTINAPSFSLHRHCSAIDPRLFLMFKTLKIIWCPRWRLIDLRTRDNFC